MDRAHHDQLGFSRVGHGPDQHRDAILLPSLPHAASPKPDSFLPSWCISVIGTGRPIGAKRWRCFFAGIPASQVLGGPLAAVLLRLHWMGLSGWEMAVNPRGLPAVAIGLTLFYLTERPQDAAWLPDDEREWLVGELAREQTTRQKHVSAWKALGNPQVLLLAAILFLGLNSNYGVSIWLPRMVQRLSTYGVSQVSLIASIPSVASLPLMMLTGWSSDRTGERIWHTAIPRFLSAASLGLCFFTLNNVWISVFLLSLATIGFYCAHPGFWPLPSVLMRRSAAAASLGLINSCGNLGGFSGTGFDRPSDRSHRNLWARRCFIWPRARWPLDCLFSCCVNRFASRWQEKNSLQALPHFRVEGPSREARRRRAAHRCTIHQRWS